MQKIKLSCSYQRILYFSALQDCIAFRFKYRLDIFSLLFVSLLQELKFTLKCKLFLILQSVVIRLIISLISRIGEKIR